MIQISIMAFCALCGLIGMLIFNYCILPNLRTMEYVAAFTALAAIALGFTKLFKK